MIPMRAVLRLGRWTSVFQVEIIAINAQEIIKYGIMGIKGNIFGQSSSFESIE